MTVESGGRIGLERRHCRHRVGPGRAAMNESIFGWGSPGFEQAEMLAFDAGVRSCRNDGS